MPYSDGNNSSDNNDFSRALCERIQKLDFGEFQRGVFLWLGASGFRHMLSLGRHHRRGRKSSGGADFIVVPPSLLSGSVAVQIRHWKTPIQKRAVDELRGFMLRNGTSSGLIVASAPFMACCHRAASEFPGRPIRLVSVADLAKSMTELGLGVTDNDGHPRIDEAFFRTINSVRFASAPMQE